MTADAYPDFDILDPAVVNGTVVEASAGTGKTFSVAAFVARTIAQPKNPPTPSSVEALNEDFADIVTGEKFHIIEPTPEEREDCDAIACPRLAFGFDRRSYGRLRQLIDVLNSF